MGRQPADGSPASGLKLVNGAGLAYALIFGKNLIGSVLSADTGSAATGPGIGAVAPQLALVVGIVAMLGLVTAAGREVREILSETAVRHAKQAIIVSPTGWSCPRTRHRRFTTVSR